MISYGGEGKETTDGVNESYYGEGNEGRGFEHEHEDEDEADGVRRNFLSPPAFGIMAGTP